MFDLYQLAYTIIVAQTLCFSVTSHFSKHKKSRSLLIYRAIRLFKILLAETVGFEPTDRVYAIKRFRVVLVMTTSIHLRIQLSVTGQLLLYHFGFY